MTTTIRYILEHPEEFNQEDAVVVIGVKKTYNDVKRKPKKKENNLCQFELLGKHGKHIPISEFEKLKRITGLTAEDKSISYQVDRMWFVTRSQKVLDKVNANYGTAFSFVSYNDMNDMIPEMYEYE